MKLSIITVAYNSAKTIRKTIESVVNQRIDNFEYIIIDGGSEDETAIIVNEYIEKYDIKFVSEKDNGIYDAMNKGIMMAEGDYIGIINSDDWYETGALQTVMNAIKNSNKDVYYGMMRLVDSKSLMEIGISFLNHQYMEKGMINHPTMFVKKSVYKSVGMYATRYRYSADYEFALRIRKRGDVSFEPLYSIIANFRTDGASSSVVAIKETQTIKKEYGIINYAQYVSAYFFLCVKNIFRYPSFKEWR